MLLPGLNAQTFDGKSHLKVKKTYESTMPTEDDVYGETMETINEDKLLRKINLKP